MTSCDEIADARVEGRALSEAEQTHRAGCERCAARAGELSRAEAWGAELANARATWSPVNRRAVVGRWSAVAGLVLVLAAGFALKARLSARGGQPAVVAQTVQSHALEGVLTAAPSQPEPAVVVAEKPSNANAVDPGLLGLAQLQRDVAAISRHNPVAYDAAYAGYGPIASSLSPRRIRPLAGLGITVSPLWTTSEE